MDPDIKAFIESIGAAAPKHGDDDYKLFRRIFRRDNYFILNNTLLIIKISRIDKPFWGIKKEILDLMDSANKYQAILLTSAADGYYFNKADVQRAIREEKWKFRPEDGTYKIHFPYQGGESFNSGLDYIAKSNILATI